MLDSFGKRLKYCRSLIGINSKEFVAEIHKLDIKIGYEAFNRWETDVIKRPKKTILYGALTTFKKLGLNNLTIEWLLNGEGIPPLPIHLDQFNEDEQAYFLPFILSDKHIYIKKTVAGNWAKPFASIGSHLIIKKIYDNNLLDTFIDKLIFCESINQTFHIGILKEKNDDKLVYINDDNVYFLNIADVSFIGRVVWIKYN